MLTVLEKPFEQKEENTLYSKGNIRAEQGCNLHRQNLDIAQISNEYFFFFFYSLQTEFELARLIRRRISFLKLHLRETINDTSFWSRACSVQQFTLLS